MRRLLTILCGGLLVWAGQLRADDNSVVVLATQRIPKVDRVIEALARDLAPATVVVHDMQGKQHLGEQIVRGLSNALKPETRIVSLGAPATRLATDHLKGHRIVSTFVGTRGASTARDAGAVVVASDPGSVQMLRALVTLWPGVRRVGVVHSAPHAAMVTELAQGFAAHAFEIVPIPVQGPRDLPDEVERHADALDGFIFLRESSALNRRSLSKVVRVLHNHRKPAVGYSRFLVAAGFPSAVIIDEASVASQLAAHVTRSKPVIDAGERLFINRAFVEALNLDISSLPERASLL